MSRTRYIQIGLVLCILLGVNLFPRVWLGGVNSSSRVENISLDFYPERPNNFTLLNTDTTVTLRFRNNSEHYGEFTYDLTGISENVFLNGRDGATMPHTIGIGDGENNYQSFATISYPPYNEPIELEFTVKNRDGEIVEVENYRLRVSEPELTLENLEEIAGREKIGSQFNFLLVPRYRSYWHPNRSPGADKDSKYVWLICDENRNVIVDDGSGDVIANCVKTNLDGYAYGEAKLWSDKGWENFTVPTVKLTGDLSYTSRRFELYFTKWDNTPAWVVRQILYWNEYGKPKIENGGVLNEVPDSERVEIWFSADDGKEITTISDFHHYAFRHPPIGEYVILSDVHSPLPADMGCQMWFTAIANYGDVYPNAEVPYDRLGFTSHDHPLTRILFEKYYFLVLRNIFGGLLICSVFLAPVLWKRWKE